LRTRQWVRVNALTFVIFVAASTAGIALAGAPSSLLPPARSVGEVVAGSAEYRAPATAGDEPDVGANAVLRTQVTINLQDDVYIDFALPLLMDNGLSQLKSQMGPVDDTRWRLLRWNPVGGRYDEADAIAGGINYGRGYWLIASDPRTVNFEGFLVDQAVDSDSTLILVGGLPGGAGSWHQIGNPFNQTISLDAVVVEDELELQWTLSGARSAGLTDGLVWQYDHGRNVWTNPSCISAKRSVFFRKTTAESLTLWAGLDLCAGESPVARTDSPAMWQWALEIVGLFKGSPTQPVMVGAAEVTGVEYNPLCTPLPPAVPGSTLRVAVSQRNWGKWSGEYSEVFVAQADSMRWRLVVDAFGGNGFALLGTRGQHMPAGMRLYHRVSTESSWSSFRAGENLAVGLSGVPVELELLAVFDARGIPDSGDAQSSRDFVASPNPFRDDTSLLYQLDRSATVHCSVYDSSGRLVRTLPRIQAAAGANQLMWDGRDDHGRTVVDGTYIMKLTTPEGQTSEKVTRIR